MFAINPREKENNKKGFLSFRNARKDGTFENSKKGTL